MGDLEGTQCTDFSAYSLHSPNSYHKDQGRGICVVLGWCETT
ncbi:hypothetical protein HU200_032947 [Digitaria exilis]|uniref:Uncharacterized protein n=1 Tax=Digitaria exilis TaxID=1010633 RepID=A0A835BSY7_9POAL|nr:hypothetical protein HU200_032947 [Digitaria exilis]